MTTGNLHDCIDHILLKNCTLEEAINWLKQFNRNLGWRGGLTTWFPHGSEPAIEVCDDNSKLLTA